MMDVRTWAHTTLMGIFPPEAVFAEAMLSSTGVDWPDEFVTFSVIAEVDEGFADNKNILTDTTVDVKWFGKSLNLKTTRPLEIVQAMKAAGFRPRNRGMDISRDPGAVYYGVVMDFVYQQVNFGG